MRAYAFAILASSCAVGVAQAADPSQEGQVTVSFQRTPLNLVIAQLQRQTETNLVLAPGVNGDASIDLVATDKPLAEVLDSLLRGQKLTRTAWAGAWVIHPKGATLPAETAVSGAGARALQLPLSVDYKGADPAAVVQRVEARTKVPVALPARVRLMLRRRGATVSLRLFGLPAHQVLDQVALQLDVTWSLDKGRVTLAPIAGKTDAGVDLSVETKDEADIARLVARLRSDSKASREAAARELTLLGPACLPKLGEGLQASGESRLDDEACVAALRVMADVGDASQYAAALAVFKDEARGTEVQIAAADALGATRAEQAAPDLIEALNGKESLRRSEAARRALVTIGEPALEALLARYRAEVKGRKPQGLIYRALLIMGEIKTDAARAELVRALKTEGRSDFAISLRHHAAIGLGMTGEPKVIPQLVEALERERDFLIAKYITRSLTWLTEETFPPDAVAWRAWWDGPGKRKFASSESAEDLLKRLAGGTVELEKDASGATRLDEKAAERAQRLIAQLSDPNATRVRSAEQDLLAMGEAALDALRKASAGEGPAAKRAATLVGKIEATLGE